MTVCLWRPAARLLLAGLCLVASSSAAGPADTLRFEGKRGQVEVGGPYAGAEFHHSRPLPSRISFYYPVANSIDQSTDYWQRDASKPFSVRLTVGGRAEELGEAPAAYTWAPHRVRFEREAPGYAAEAEYRFAADLPLLVFRLRVVNRSAAPQPVEVATRLQAALRTSHAYAVRDTARARYRDGGATFTADFDAADTGGAQLFVLNAGAAPEAHGAAPPRAPEAAFTYRRQLAPGEALEVVQLIGTARQAEADALRQRAARTWEASVAAYERGVAAAVDRRALGVPDAGLARTARLAKALLRANRHYLDGQIVPMPCPAEYNFFFTHDLLVTDLGAVLFDTARVRDDLRYLRSLAGPDSVLPHAYYWRDGRYVTEPAGDDNWNHLWFVLVAASYLHHSGDTATVGALYPMLRKSVRLMLRNERDGLMHAIRPDWWDIGRVYGARAYLTTLAVRALEAYAAVTVRLGRVDPALPGYAARGRRMRAALVERLWDEQAGYLLNQLDTASVDRHYYSGPLLAAAFGVLDGPRRQRLLDTAARELLDPHLGIRNAMPADFHRLVDVYRFNGQEAGAPYRYMNGGIWPQGTAWYALALAAAGRPDAARDALARYLSLDGILASPNGQPAFYEVRFADASSPHFGEVDKPTFLWAGGWFLNVLYRLAGVREDAWTLAFDPVLPAGFDTLAYDLMVYGVPARVTWRGEGRTFRRIRWDGAPAPSAVLTGPVGRVELERGRPEAPYLAAATALVRAVAYDASHGTLAVRLDGVPGQDVTLTAVAPSALASVAADGATAGVPEEEAGEAGGTTVRVPLTLTGGTAEVVLRFR